MSSPCTQPSFSGHPLTPQSEVQTDLMHFVNPLPHQSYESSVPVSGAPLLKTEPPPQEQRRFSYADLLSEPTPDYDNGYLSVPPASSPSNDSSDGYHTAHSSRCGSADHGSTSSSNNQEMMPPPPPPAFVPSIGVPFISQHPTSTMFSSAAVHPLAMTTTAPAVTAAAFSNSSMGLSPAPPIFQHRHSIAAAAASSPFGVPEFFDNTAQRHHSFSHPPSSLLDPQQPAPFMTSDGMFLRPVPSFPVMGGLSVPDQQDDQQRRLSAHSTKSDKVTTTKTPRSRGRRVSNVPSANGARMFTCTAEGCGKVFKRSEHLKRHIRSIHTLEKRKFLYVCYYVWDTYIDAVFYDSFWMSLSNMQQAVLQIRQSEPAHPYPSTQHGR